MEIVTELGGRGKGFVATAQGGASPKQGWIRGHWERPDPPEGRESTKGGPGRPSAADGGAQE